MSKNNKYMNSTKEVLERSENMEKEIKEPEIMTAQKTSVEEIAQVKENKQEQEFKVYSIVNEKAVMAKGLKDGKWYSKPNKGYKIGQIIK